MIQGDIDQCATHLEACRGVVHHFRLLYAAGRDAAQQGIELLCAEGVFGGSGIFKSGDPAKRAAAIVKAVTNFTDAKLIAELSEDLGEAMVGINENEIKIIMEERGK